MVDSTPGKGAASPAQRAAKCGPDSPGGCGQKVVSCTAPCYSGFKYLAISKVSFFLHYNYCISC